MAGTFQVTADDLRDISTALRTEQDGVKLGRDLARRLRQAVEPAVTEAKGRVLAMDSGGLRRDGGSLRAAVAAKVGAQALLSGKRAGVRVRARKSGMPRGFANAPKRLNSDKGWRHPVPPPRLARGVEGPQRPPVWVRQVGAPNWFDDPMQARVGEYQAAIRQAVQDMADRIKGGM